MSEKREVILPTEKHRRAKIRNICETFVAELNVAEVAEHPLVFVILSEAAESMGYRLNADQRGVQGTVVTLVKEKR
jgi:hypothetical protein